MEHTKRASKVKMAALRALARKFLCVFLAVALVVPDAALALSALPSPAAPGAASRAAAPARSGSAGAENSHHGDSSGSASETLLMRVEEACIYAVLSACVYDSGSNRLIEEVLFSPDGVRPGAVIRRGYDDYGNLTSYTNGNGKTWHFGYDNLDRLIPERDPLGRETTYQWDLAGRLIQKTDAKGQVASYGWDALGPLERVEYADGEFAVMGYEAAGRRAEGGLWRWDARPGRGARCCHRGDVETKRRLRRADPARGGTRDERG